MKQVATVLILVWVLISSCKREEPVPPQPYHWDEQWACFTGTFIGSSDTLQIGFSSNQGATLSADCRTVQSLLPWEDEARYSSSIDGDYRFEVTKALLNFDGINWDDVPEDEAFIDYFRSGYDSLVQDNIEYPRDQGVEVIFTDLNGWTFTSADGNNNGNRNYTCRLTDYHPFTNNGVQYVKVKMFFDGIQIKNVMGDWYILRNCEYEGYFKNQ